jgi:GMP synthase-like glutamine amidotransferase
MYKVFASAGYDGYLMPLISAGMQMSTSREDADIILFAGGADISPALYGQTAGSRTYFHPGRDTIEMDDFYYGRAHNKAIVGVCRGMQLITALTGGELIQDVSNHAGRRHDMHTYDGKTIQVNSLHHQMCNPWAGDAKFTLLGWANGLSNHYHGEKDTQTGRDKVIPHTGPEPEACYWPDYRAFAVQYHPEMMSHDSQAVQWYITQVKKLMKGTLS